jgi:hypothetical protein
MAPPAAAEGSVDAASDGALEAAAVGAADSAAVGAVVGAVVAPPPDEQAAATSRAATNPESLVTLAVRIEVNMGRLLDLKDVLDHSPGDALFTLGLVPTVSTRADAGDLLHGPAP